MLEIDGSLELPGPRARATLFRVGKPVNLVDHGELWVNAGSPTYGFRSVVGLLVRSAGATLGVGLAVLMAELHRQPVPVN